MRTENRIFAGGARAALAAAALAWAPAPAGAAESGALTITLTPVSEFGVLVDTASFAFTVGVGTPAFTSSPVGIEIVGNAQPVELELAGSVTPSAPWILDPDETPGTDQLRVYALFSTVARSSRPVDADFTGSAERLVTSSPKRAGARGGGGGGFEHPSLGADMDGLPVGARRRLWLRLDAPSASTTAKPRTLEITVTATRDDP